MLQPVKEIEALVGFDGTGGLAFLDGEGCADENRRWEWGGEPGEGSHLPVIEAEGLRRLAEGGAPGDLLGKVLRQPAGLDLLLSQTDARLDLGLDGAVGRHPLRVEAVEPEYQERGRPFDHRTVRAGLGLEGPHARVGNHAALREEHSAACGDRAHPADLQVQRAGGGVEGGPVQFLRGELLQ